MTNYPHKPLGETFEEKVKKVVAANKRAMRELLQRLRKQRAKQKRQP
jgi:hypothetical protein